MRTAIQKLTITVLLTAVFAFAQQANARFITLAIGGSGSTLTNEVTVGTNEVAVVKGGVDNKGTPDYYLRISRSDYSFRLPSTVLNFESVPAGKATVVGPATLSLTTWNPHQPRSETESAFVTIEIIPESFPPDKTIIVPADTGGANIILEGSTDLIHWTNAPPGAYTNLTTHMFFRIRAERVP